METLFFLRSLVADENVSLEIFRRIHLTVELQVIRSLRLNFAILSCLSPTEATELLERIRCGSPCLKQVYAWEEYFMQSLQTSTPQLHNQTFNWNTYGETATISVFFLCEKEYIAKLKHIIELSPQHLNTPENHLKPQCLLWPPTQYESIDFSDADDIRKLKTSRPGPDTLNDDSIQWESWLSSEMNWDNPSYYLSKYSLSGELETVVSRQDMFWDNLKPLAQLTQMK